MMRRALVLGVLVVLWWSAPAGAQTTTTVPNADALGIKLAGGSGRSFAAMVVLAGVAGLGVALLQRYLHAAVRVS